MLASPWRARSARSGFDALCAIHPLPVDRSLPAGPAAARAGARRTSVGGCAVIPRIPLSSSVADIALRAFLDHPVVLYGHHEDVAGRPRAAGRGRGAVNRLGDVRWMSVGDIAHQQRRAPAGRRRRRRAAATRAASASRPAGARPCACRRRPTRWTAARWRAGRLGDGPLQPFGDDVPWQGNGHVEIRLRGAQDLDASDVAAPAWRPWPKLRRAATEARDRLLPLRS